MLSMSGSIRIGVIDGNLEPKDIKVSFEYTAEPSSTYDIPPLRDLNYWSDDIDVDSLSPQDRGNIEERLLEIVNDTPNAI